MHAVNPVVRGCAPDPSMIQVGGTYYLATSSFEWFPTIPLYRSDNLIDWEYAGSVGTAVPQGTLSGIPDSAGIWAPALSHSDGLFWVVYSIVRSLGGRFFDLETYMCTAWDIGGPWSAPVRLPGHGFDPSLVHHDGRHWLLNLQNDPRVGGRRFDGIVLTELEFPRSGETIDVPAIRARGNTRLLLQRGTLIEGPKITVKDGWFYLLLAEGGTGVEHGVLVARSRRIEGPYELDEAPLLTTRDDPDVPLQKAGHGELLQTSSGEWYLSHLASRPLRTERGPRNPLGRETVIQPIVWVDGWPRLAHGGWHPAVVVEVPGVRSPTPAVAPIGLDVAPGWPWSTLREPPGDWVDTSARPGWVRLRGRHGPLSLWDQSLLAQRLTEHRATVEVTVDAEPDTLTQSAGLVLWYNTTSYIQLHLTWAEPEGEPQAGQQWAGRGRCVLVLEHGRPDGARILATVDAPGRPVRMRATIDGPAAQLWAGSEGQELTRVGPEIDFSELSDDFGPTLRFTGAFAGISACDLVEGRFTADFTDWALTVASAPPFRRREA